MALPKQYTHAGFPPCISLTIEFNRHAVYYETAQQWLDGMEASQQPEWVSDEEKATALATDSVWVCHWYPDTPVGSYEIAASSFEVLMAYVNGMVQEPRA